MSHTQNESGALAFLDLETTGLNPTKDLILQVGIIVTDLQLNEIAVFDGVIGWPDEMVQGLLSDYTREMHTKTGLLDRVKASDTDTCEVEILAEAFLKAHFPAEDCRGRLVKLAGSSVHFDMSFLRVDMPDLFAMFHHRYLDVSVLKEICNLWTPEAAFTDFPKDAEHNAIADNRYSIASLRHYGAHLLARNPFAL